MPIAKDTGRFCDGDWHRGQKLFECPVCGGSLCEMCERRHGYAFGCEDNGDEPSRWDRMND